MSETEKTDPVGGRIFSSDKSSPNVLEDPQSRVPYKKKRERKEKKYERVRGKRLLGGRWLEPLGEVGGQKTSEKSSVELDGVRWYSQTVRQRRQTDRQTCGKE